jgi:intracellular sulfur oxidation DsrE/DsrF family protein
MLGSGLKSQGIEFDVCMDTMEEKGVQEMHCETGLNGAP